MTNSAQKSLKLREHIKDSDLPNFIISYLESDLSISEAYVASYFLKMPINEIWFVK